MYNTTDPLHWCTLLTNQWACHEWVPLCPTTLTRTCYSQIARNSPSGDYFSPFFIIFWCRVPASNAVARQASSRGPYHYFWLIRQQGLTPPCYFWRSFYCFLCHYHPPPVPLTYSLLCFGTEITSSFWIISFSRWLKKLSSTIGWCMRAEDGPMMHMLTRLSGHRLDMGVYVATWHDIADSNGLAVSGERRRSQTMEILHKCIMASMQCWAKKYSIV